MKRFSDIRIVTKLVFGMFVILLSAIVLGSAIFMMDRRVNQEVRKRSELETISRTIFDLNQLLADLLLFQGERPKVQWRSKYNSLAEAISSPIYSAPTEQAILQRIRDDHQDLRHLFNALLKSQHRQALVPGAADRERIVTGHLMSQISIKSQGMIAAALELEAMIDRNILSNRRTTTIMIALFASILGIELLMVLLLIHASVIKPIIQLQRGTERLATGDLDYQVPLDQDTELGRLARAFNAMSRRLKKSFSALEIQIRERERAEADLINESEELRVTLNSIGDGVITTSPDGRVHLLNPIASELIGWPQGEAQGMPLEKVFRVMDARDRSVCDDPVAQIKETGRLFVLDAQPILIARNGTEVLISANGAPMFNEESSFIGVAVVFRDVTRQRSLEQEAMRMQKLESVGVLAGGIAHDFNNILTAILGNLSLAAFELDPSHESYDLLKESEKACLRAKKLTHQLLTFSKGGSPVKTTAQMPELLTESAHFALRGSNVDIEFHLEPGLWPADVDTGQISQAIQNLVINAMQAMREGGLIQLYAKNFVMEDSDDLPLETGKYLRVTIADQGAGILPEDLDRIFDPYFSTKKEGSGLGLAIIHSIVTNHNGHISVESRAGMGTKFHMYLPANALEQITAEDFEPVTPSRPRVGKGNILIMDDEKLIGKIAGRMLNRLGYKFEIAINGEHAIEKFIDARSASQPFDLVILDLTIRGGMGGREVVKTLLEIDPDIRCIVSSGYSNDPVLANFRNFGFHGVVVKPYNFAGLKEIVQKFLVPIESPSS